MLRKQSLSLDYGKNGKRGQRQYQKISIGLPEHTIGVSCLTSHEERCILLLSGIEVGTPRATVRRYRLLPCAKQRSRKVRQRAGTFWLLSFLIGDCKQAVRFDSICILAREHVMFPCFFFRRRYGNKCDYLLSFWFAIIMARTFKGRPNRLIKPSASLWLYSSPVVKLAMDSLYRL